MMTCKYCRKTVHSEPIVDSYGEYDAYESVVIEHNSGKYWLNLYTENDNIAVPINFCPKCGRNLNEETK